MMMDQKILRGGCHCGTLTYQLAWPTDVEYIPARSCGCSFCTRINGRWTSHPEATLEISWPEGGAPGRYRFGTKTADFMHCRYCGIVCIAVCSIEGRDYAVVNVNTFQPADQVKLDESASDFDGELLDDRLDRRQQRWIATVSYESSD